MSFPISTDIFGQLKWLIKQVKLLIFKTSRLQNSGTYKTYVAALSQTGVGAPVVTAILENTIGDITWSYLGVGQYIGTLTNAFTQNKTYVNSTNSCTVIDSFLIGSIVVFPLDVNRIYIITTQNPGSEFRDDVLGTAGNIIEIRVYD